jgi:hypothetical protein
LEKENEAMLETKNTQAAYEIQVRGHLDDRRAAWFDEMRIEPMPDGFTRLTGPVTDQSALFGLLARVRDLGLELWRVQRLDP